ncbi:MAG: hypothetical protein ACE361_25865 [Aureliella sp.]
MAKEKEGTGFSLKDHLFNRQRVQYLAGLFASADSHFDSNAFVREAVKPFHDLELKQRIVHIAATLENHLPKDFPAACKCIVNALPPPLDPRRTDDDFGDFIFAPLGEFVVRNGLDRKMLRTSLRTLKEITQRFSMEDAIRYFINAHTEPTMRELEKWARHKNYHVRRLVSEGTRPMLPWSGRIAIDVTGALPLLDTLHADSTRYVTRSVANHLNDISKSHPDVVVERLGSWKKMKQQDPVELDWMCKHATRTLIKQGDKGALRLLGFRARPRVEVNGFRLESSKVKRGDYLAFSFDIKAARSEPLIVDYIIDFLKADGSTSPKVHKLKQVTIANGDSVRLKKRHKLHANATTYTLYPGVHRVTLQINGKRFDTADFVVT